MTDGCASDTQSKSGSACTDASGQWLKTYFNKKLTRFQNSVVSYDKYIIIYGFNLHWPTVYTGPQSSIIYLNVETEQWQFPYNQPKSGTFSFTNIGWTSMKEKSKKSFIS